MYRVSWAALSTIARHCMAAPSHRGIPQVSRYGCACHQCGERGHWQSGLARQRCSCAALDLQSAHGKYPCNVRVLNLPEAFHSLNELLGICHSDCLQLCWPWEYQWSAHRWVLPRVYSPWDSSGLVVCRNHCVHFTLYRRV